MASFRMQTEYSLVTIAQCYGNALRINELYCAHQCDCGSYQMETSKPLNRRDAFNSRQLVRTCSDCLTRCSIDTAV